MEAFTEGFVHLTFTWIIQYLFQFSDSYSIFWIMEWLKSFFAERIFSMLTKWSKKFFLDMYAN